MIHGQREATKPHRREEWSNVVRSADDENCLERRVTSLMIGLVLPSIIVVLTSLSVCFLWPHLIRVAVNSSLA